jgi:transposase
MVKPYSSDLRDRFSRLFDKGMAARAAARHLDLSESTGVKWGHQLRTTGRLIARPMGGDHRSKLTDEREWLLARVKEKDDLTLEQFRAELAERGVRVSVSAIWFFFAREKISFKKKPAAHRAGTA